MALVALLDANVLWSATLRDTLLRAAEYQLYQPAWTHRILQEMASSLKAKRPHLIPTRIDGLVAQIVGYFPDALVEGYEPLIPQMSNHPGDRHVLAAAVRAGANVIVTSNRRHFLPTARDVHAIAVQSPDQFLCQLWRLDATIMIAILDQQGRDLRPPRTARDVVQTLARDNAARRFAALVLGTEPR
jgi:predicted nucleic acid-binding protein